MRLYEVGGAVRDSLLGLAASDRDWVAVGATPEQMLAAGYKPVGRDFPVFLHPETGEEVALARTERKSGRGYHGFAFHADVSVTLEDDLRRRDLTINAMARDARGQIIDPYGGQRDLKSRLLRHVSEAFVEDPVRLLRVARLAARFVTFTVAPETLALLQHMVAAGEIDHLVPERVWQELSRGLMEAQPSRMLAVLADTGALIRLLPEIAHDVALRAIWLDEAARRNELLPVRFACLCDGPLPAVSAISSRWGVPRDCSELASLLAREGAAVLTARMLDADALIGLFNRADAWRRPQRWQALLSALAVRHGSSVPMQELAVALSAAVAVDVGAVASAATAGGLRGEAIAAAVAQARARAVASALCQDGPHAAG